MEEININDPKTYRKTIKNLDRIIDEEDIFVSVQLLAQIIMKLDQRYHDMHAEIVEHFTTYHSEDLEND